jgi:hypothetical protein
MKNLPKIVFLFITASLFSQSPWTQKKGEAYTQFSFTSIANYTAIFGDPDYSTERSITDNTLQLYSEYGLTDKTSLLLNVPLKLISTNELVDDSAIALTTEDNETSLGNIELSLKHNFYKKNWLITGQLSVEANTATFNEASGIRTGYDAWTVTPLFIIGKSFNEIYIQAFTGVNIRSNDYSSNFKLGGEIGKKITDKIWLIGFLDISKSLNDGTINLPTNNASTALYVNNQEYGSFGLKAIGEFTDSFGATFGFGGAFFGNNVAKAPALTIGLYKKF